MSLCGELFGLNGLLPPVRRGHDVTIHHIHVSSGLFLSLVATQGDQTKEGRRRVLRSFTSLLFASPLLPSYLPRSNPIPMLPSPSSSSTQTELCVHSLIHYQSYLSSGTIDTAQARLETTACRKITLIPQDCWTLSRANHISQAACHFLTLNTPHCLLGKN